MEEKKIEEGVPSKEEIKEVSPKTTRKTTKKTSTKTKTSGKPKSQNVEVISLDLNDDSHEEEAKHKKQLSEEAKSEALLYELKKKETIDTVNPVKEEKSEEIEKDEEIVLEDSIPRYYDTPITEGLTDEIVEARKSLGLVNSTGEEKGKSIPAIIFSNIFTFFNMLYFVIAAILIIFKSYNNLGFLPLIFANLAIGIFQEIRAKITVEKMTLLSAPTATVIRNGVKLEIPVNEIVLDDIIFFSSGSISFNCFIIFI